MQSIESRTLIFFLVVFFCEAAPDATRSKQRKVTISNQSMTHACVQCWMPQASVTGPCSLILLAPTLGQAQLSQPLMQEPLPFRDLVQIERLSPNLNPGRLRMIVPKTYKNGDSTAWWHQHRLNIYCTSYINQLRKCMPKFFLKSQAPFKLGRFPKQVCHLDQQSCA